jgi:5-hydroxyisourate hydrolase
MDAAFGVPAANVKVGLRRTTVSGWINVAEMCTGPDGWLTVSLGEMYGSATFRIEFDLDRYYSAMGSVSLFPRLIVVFRVANTDEDLHLPLLISPNLLLTYRGSGACPTV